MFGLSVRRPTDEELAEDEYMRDQEWIGEAERLEKLRQHVRAMSQRPALEVRTRGPRSSGFHATNVAPDNPGFYLMRRTPHERWSAVEVVRDVRGDLWVGWNREPAHRLADTRYEWCQPALGQVPQ